MASSSLKDSIAIHYFFSWWASKKIRYNSGLWMFKLVIFNLVASLTIYFLCTLKNFYACIFLFMNLNYMNALMFIKIRFFLLIFDDYWSIALFRYHVVYSLKVQFSLDGFSIMFGFWVYWVLFIVSFSLIRKLIVLFSHLILSRYIVKVMKVAGNFE